MSKRSILFVDDEPNVLQGLQRSLRPMRHEWTMTFASSGKQALDLMDAQYYDVVVSDMRMPGMDGVQLLNEVMQRSPRTVRLALSGQTYDETMLRLTGPTHQFLSKPCEPQLLRDTVNRALALRSILHEDRLVTLVSKLRGLPVLPQSYSLLLEELHVPDVSIKAVARIIEKDVGMAVKTLQWVNSALFGVRHTVTSVTHAVSLLGLDIIRTMVLTMGVFSDFSKRALCEGFSLPAFMDHSIAVGAYAKRVAELAGCTEDTVHDAFTAGMLHDIGRLILASGCPAEYAAVIAESTAHQAPLEHVEFQAFGTTHAEVGGYLLGLWGFPDQIVEATAFHHRPAECLAQGPAPVVLVHAADYLAHIAGVGGSEPVVEADSAVCATAGFDVLDPEWQRACLRTVEKDEMQ